MAKDWEKVRYWTADSADQLSFWASRGDWLKVAAYVELCAMSTPGPLLPLSTLMSKIQEQGHASTPLFQGDEYLCPLGVYPDGELVGPVSGTPLDVLTPLVQVTLAALKALGHGYSLPTNAYPYPHITTVEGDILPATWRTAHRLFMESVRTEAMTGKPSPSQGAAKIGLFGKYLLAKADGTELNPSAEYFVVRYDDGAAHGHAGRAALLEYADKIQGHCPELARDLLAKLKNAPEQEIRARAMFLLQRGA